MDLPRRLALLRASLYDPPSEEGWSRILSALDPEDDALPLALDYAAPHLDSAWPDALRVAPSPWVQRLLAGLPPHPAWAVVRSIEAPSRGWGEEAATKLARSPATKHLTRLVLPRNRFGAKALGHLADSPYVGRVERLDLTLNGVDDEALSVLGASRGLRALARLTLDEDRTAQRPVEDVASGAFLQALVRLEAARLDAPRAGAISGAGLEAWCSLAHPALRELSLAFHRVEPAWAARLGQAQTLPALETLDLSHNGLDAEALEELLRGRGLPSLRRLRALGTPTGPQARARLETLAQARAVPVVLDL